jgi:3-hydroxybutyryl-CoA dehydrogenase
VNLIILGEADSGLADFLSDRFQAAGHAVHRAAPDAHLEREARGADALLDCWIVDGSRKRSELGRYSRWLPAGAPILSCCHAHSATALAAGLPRGAARLSGFALPAPWGERNLVECARPMQFPASSSPSPTADAAVDLDSPSDQALRAAEAVWKSLDLEPVWVADSAGLVLPRILACLANEAFFALMEGAANAEDIDRAMKLGTRYPRGPLEWAEIIGLDQVLATMDALAAEQGEERYRAAPLLRRMVAGGLWNPFGPSSHGSARSGPVESA